MYTSYVFHFSSHVHICIDSLSIYGNQSSQQNKRKICNTLAEQFAFNSSSDNYSYRFNRYRLTVERNKIDFATNVHYSYNDVFT